jgi:flagellar biosynthesis activator protein FlaF
MSAAYLEAYKTAKNSIEMSGREIEAAALTRCALLLSDCQKDWDAPNNDVNLTEALRINQRVWSILQGELTSADNPLPKKLKEDLLSLSIFIDRRIIQVMAHPEPEKLNIIIDINLNIAAGLKSSPNKEEKAEDDQNVIPMPPQRLSQTGIRA